MSDSSPDSIAEDLARQVGVFTGQVTDVEAHVYVRLTGSAATGRAITGKLTGPYSEYAHTLPFDTHLTDLGCEPSRLLRAIVPDPCVWTPQLPYLYHLELAWQGADGVRSRIKRTVGVRRWGTDGEHLFLDGRRVVLRGARVQTVSESLVRSWREEGLVMFVNRPSNAECELASRWGVFLLADVTAVLPAVQLVEIERLTRWPSVAAVVVSLPKIVVEREVSHGTLLAQRVPAPNSTPADWAQLILFTAGEDAAQHRQCKRSLPAIGVRFADTLANPSDVRINCERLQRDLAPALDLAGYFV